MRVSKTFLEGSSAIPHFFCGGGEHTTASGSSWVRDQIAAAAATATPQPQQR